MDFDAAYVLATRSFGAQRISGRYDWFQTVNRDAFVDEDNNNEDGSAWTLAYLVDLGERLRLAAEWMRVESTRPARATIGVDPRRIEYSFQLSLRLSL